MDVNRNILPTYATAAGSSGGGGGGAADFPGLLVLALVEVEVIPCID